MKLIRFLLRAMFSVRAVLGPSIPREQLRAGQQAGRPEPQFVTLVNGGVPIH